jgi:fumarate reductase flavoprotein subunit
MDNLPGSKPANLDKVLRTELEKGTTEIFEADSIEELAKKLGIEPAVLKATVDEYNRFCEKGHDDLFAKDPRHLRPIRGPRFYAIRVRTVTLGTLGGIKINERMEVVDKKDEAIPGLYAGGEDAAGMCGDSYPLNIASGGSSAFAVTSGRIAAKNALSYMAD